VLPFLVSFVRWCGCAEMGIATLSMLLNHPLDGSLKFVPLLPFSPEEQAAVVHKFLLELDKKVRPPIKLTEKDENLLGNVRLRVLRDASV
jgi:hypothetical protein